MEALFDSCIELENAALPVLHRNVATIHEATGVSQRGITVREGERAVLGVLPSMLVDRALGDGFWEGLT
jgi:hypothetical protein